MKIKSGIYNLYNNGEKEKMEKEIAKLLEEGYEILACNMTYEPKEKISNRIYAEPIIFLMMKKN